MQDLGRGITLEIVDMLHQVNGLGGGYPGDWTCYNGDHAPQESGGCPGAQPGGWGSAHPRHQTPTLGPPTHITFRPVAL